MHSPFQWDIFCQVIDNFGDIGVAWRLARRLANDFKQTVRLWIDDLNTFQKIEPAIKPNLSEQTVSGVLISHWNQKDFPSTIQPAVHVIEAFGCHLPAAFENQMAHQTPPPVWINLEYLSYESWTKTYHGLPSPHPHLALKKYFFFPGIFPETGGQICENDLPATRNAWQKTPVPSIRFFEEIAQPPTSGADYALKISLFCYENPMLLSLIEDWANHQQSILCIVPNGKILPYLSNYLGSSLHLNQAYQHGALTLFPIPMLTQAQYDQLLWSCDLNFVRGEDSLVRAQWAAKPFIWHCYPQEEETHLTKLEAFLTAYTAGLSSKSILSITQFHQAWNAKSSVKLNWESLFNTLPEWQSHSRLWPKKCLEDGDLVDKLLRFVEKVRYN